MVEDVLVLLAFIASLVFAYRLNPCCGGRCSSTLQIHLVFNLVFNVLILVVVEDVLVHILKH